MIFNINYEYYSYFPRALQVSKVLKVLKMWSIIKNAEHKYKYHWLINEHELYLCMWKDHVWSMSGVGYWSRARAWIFYHSGGLRHRHMVVTAPPFLGLERTTWLCPPLGGPPSPPYGGDGGPPFFLGGEGERGKGVGLHGLGLGQGNCIGWVGV